MRVKLQVRSPEAGDEIADKLPRRAGGEHVGECDERRRHATSILDYSAVATRSERGWSHSGRPPAVSDE